jgi:hypothetical protein
MTTAYRQIADAPVLGQTANAVAIPWVQVTPFNYANIQYEVRKLEQVQMPSPAGMTSPAMMIGNVLMTGSLTLQGADYAAWSDDDNYLYEKVAEKLGLTLLPEAVTDTPPPQ